MVNAHNQYFFSKFLFIFNIQWFSLFSSYIYVTDCLTMGVFTSDISSHKVLLLQDATQYCTKVGSTCSEVNRYSIDRSVVVIRPASWRWRNLWVVSSARNQPIEEWRSAPRPTTRPYCWCPHWFDEMFLLSPE